MYRTNSETTDKKSGKNEFRSAIWFSLAIFVFVTIYSLVSGNGGTISYQIDNNVLGVGCVGSAEFIELSNIDHVELTEHLDVGEAISAESTETIYAGTYRNSTYGEYSLYAFADSDVYLVVHHTDGILVLSGKKEKETQSLYQSLQDAIAS